MTGPSSSIQPAQIAPDRGATFSQITSALEDWTAFQTPNTLVASGNSLAVIESLPDASISLIVTDPPYHSTKKANVAGDRDFAKDEEYLDWIESYGREWHRVLRPNGSLYIFCSTEMSAQMEARIGCFLRPLSHLTWTKPNDPGFDGWKGKMQKEALRRWYPHSERILFFEQAVDGHVRRSPLGLFLRRVREEAGLSGHQLTEAVGAYGRVNHGGAVSNWETGRNIPSRSQYYKIVEALEGTGKVTGLPPYEDIVRPFSVSRDIAFTDVWDFPSVRPYRGKHPAEKPVDLIAHIIKTSSYEGDIVLDCFAGSGATIEAALRLNRRVVGIELDSRWVERSIDRARSAAQEREESPNGTLARDSKKDAGSVALRS
jgi:adenine-specific DNA-methyltransferase